MHQAAASRITVGPWSADLKTGRLSGPDGVREVEPKVMDLLFLLARRPAEVFSRDEVMAALWPGVTVGEDTLARVVFKLRRALGDDAKAPRYVETIPKRGYRLMVPVETADIAPSVSSPPAASKLPWRIALGAAAALALGVWVWSLSGGGKAPAPSPAPATAGDGLQAADQLVARADDDYFQYTRAENEQAVELYERAIAVDPAQGRAYAGLANALAQRVIRWPQHTKSLPPERRNLIAALREGRTKTPAAVAQLARAEGLARQAVRLAPQDPAAHKALGFVRSAKGDLAGATTSYEAALRLDPNAWGPLINLADVAQIEGRQADSLARMEQAYEAMARSYAAEPSRVRPWHPRLGVAIAESHAALGQTGEAERWYRRVLSATPFDEAATAGLAGLLAKSGDREAAARLCRERVERAGPMAGCAGFVGSQP